MNPQQTEFPSDRPQRVTCGGDGLAAWCRDPRVWVHRMVCERQPGRYTLHLLWLDGRQLGTLGAKLTQPVSAAVPETGTVPAASETEPMFCEKQPDLF